MQITTTWLIDDHMKDQLLLFPTIVKTAQCQIVYFQIHKIVVKSEFNISNNGFSKNWNKYLIIIK